jgi:hypothetical protein
VPPFESTQDCTIMPYCPRCLNEYEEGSEACWNCHALLVPGDVAADAEPQPAKSAPDWQPLRPVYKAPDEFSALRMQAVLEEAGIQAAVQSAQIPWVPSVMSHVKGYWGRVLVAPAAVDAAKEIVAEYLASLDPPEA